MTSPLSDVAAWAAPAAKAKLAPFRIRRREPGPKDVLIDVAHCGVCHSDLHQVRDEWKNGIFPMVPGHEIAGRVRSVGSAVTKFRAGDPVGVGCIVDSCRTCAACREGLEQYCEVGMTGTYNSKDAEGNPTYGGYSRAIVVDESYVLKIPESLPLDAAAPLLCAGITTWSPLRHWKVGAGTKMAVVGLGGLGHMGVKLGKALGAEVTVLSHSLRKRDDALRFGATELLSTADPHTFSSSAGRFDFILNTVSAPADWSPLLECLRRDGTMCVVGAAPEPSPLGAFPLILKRRSFAGSLIGGIRETQEMLDFCGEHRIAAEIEPIPIERIDDAYDRMMESDVRYRFVIDVGTIA